MKIEKSDYIVGIWYCEKKRHEPGYSLMVVIKDVEGHYSYLIRNKFESRLKETRLKFEDNPTPEQVRRRADMLIDVARHFFPDTFEYIEVDGDYMDMMIKISMENKILLNEDFDDIFGK